MSLENEILNISKSKKVVYSGITELRDQNVKDAIKMAEDIAYQLKIFEKMKDFEPAKETQQENLRTKIDLLWLKINGLNGVHRKKGDLPFKEIEGMGLVKEDEKYILTLPPLYSKQWAKRQIKDSFMMREIMDKVYTAFEEENELDVIPGEVRLTFEYHVNHISSFTPDTDNIDLKTVIDCLTEKVIEADNAKYLKELRIVAVKDKKSFTRVIAEKYEKEKATA